MQVRIHYDQYKKYFILNKELNHIKVTRFKVMSLSWFKSFVNLYWYRKDTEPLYHSFMN